MTTGIYQIQNTLNNKVYIGSSKEIEARWRVHKSRLRLNKHHSNHLQKSYNQNPDKFIFTVLEIVADLSQLEIREQFWVDTLKSYKSEYGYNGVKTVQQTGNARMLERWAKPGERERQSERMKEVCSTEEHRQKLSAGHIEHFKNPENRFKKVLCNPLRKRVKYVETGEIFESIAQASIRLSVSLVKIRDNANGKRIPKKGLSFEWV